MVMLFFAFILLVSAENTTSYPYYYPFGTVLGTTDGVPAYSNGGSNIISKENNYVSVDGVMVFTGLRWQCVEYARRYLVQVFKVTFDSVANAAEIWNLTTWWSVNGGNQTTTVPVTSHINAASSMPPQRGSLLIWAAGTDIGPYGHVAVVVKTNTTALFITEENYDDTVSWKDVRSYSRSLRLTRNDTTGFYTVHCQESSSFKGWITMKDGERPPSIAQTGGEDETRSTQPRTIVVFICLGVLLLVIAAFACLVMFDNLRMDLPPPSCQYDSVELDVLDHELELSED